MWGSKFTKEVALYRGDSPETSAAVKNLQRISLPRIDLPGEQCGVIGKSN
jgi:hypothetical protein